MKKEGNSFLNYRELSAALYRRISRSERLKSMGLHKEIQEQEDAKAIREHLISIISNTSKMCEIMKEMNRELLDLRIKFTELEQQIKLDKVLKGEL